MSDSGLKAQLEEQVRRFETDLKDCEDMKDDLDQEEYENIKKTATEQLAEAKASLAKLTSGSLSLTTEAEAVKQATLDSISSAFQADDVRKMFESRKPDLLRERVEVLSQDVKLGKISQEQFAIAKLESIQALKVRL